jgi:T-complex protein 1 subunit beta
MASFNPTQIFEDGTTEEKGENARLSAFIGAIAVARDSFPFIQDFTD